MPSSKPVIRKATPTQRLCGGLPWRHRMAGHSAQKGILRERAEPDQERGLDLRLETRGRTILEFDRQVRGPAQSDLVDRRREHRIFGLADLVDRRHEAAGGGLSLLDRSAVSIGRDPRTDRLADA